MRRACAASLVRRACEASSQYFVHTAVFAGVPNQLTGYDTNTVRVTFRFDVIVRDLDQ